MQMKLLLIGLMLLTLVACSEESVLSSSTASVSMASEASIDFY